jgi:hypothetical protein
VQCLFNPRVDCPSFEAQKELGYKPNLKEIQLQACPQCPNGPSSLNGNNVHLRQKVPSRGNYIF